jgi:hypothetical protein
VRSVTGAGSRGRPRSPGSAAWCPRSIPAAPRPGGATAPRPATPTCAPSWCGSAWALKHRPAVGVDLRARQQGLDPAVVARAWAAQLGVVWPLPAAGRAQGLQERGGDGDRPAARRVLVGGDAGGLAMTRPAVTLLGAKVTGRCTTRRGAAAAGPIPASTMRRPCRRALRQGHLPASSRPAVLTRVHQCGGSPIHHAPARRADPRARPPPQS